MVRTSCHLGRLNFSFLYSRQGLLEGGGEVTQLSLLNKKETFSSLLSS